MRVGGLVHLMQHCVCICHVRSSDLVVMLLGNVVVAGFLCLFYLCIIKVSLNNIFTRSEFSVTLPCSVLKIVNTLHCCGEF